MPVFEVKFLTHEPNDLDRLAAILHPNAQARTEAVRRGQLLAPLAPRISTTGSCDRRSVGGVRGAPVN